ncbi:hypothetical protein SAMN05216266_11667 [Amycolatopsis marina]|uniref:DUF402 domain-containing protein n=1 Tax=Amycolatopsis marina TaxID=490629 RepID=A0A1I1BR66_9PSEU|nr:DUF402 domain-containing protein [Amycolatopsis marina]SFB52647.1 hypothetical protein SAMN05216266_11667 [Amycolatopsis marina]
MPDLHPPKTEIFDVPGMSNTDPKGIVRDVERFQVESFGLYMARPTPGRRQFHYLESWLLPGLGLRITDFWFTEGHEHDQDFYLDVVDIERHDDRWRATDLYLDIVLRDARGLDVLDSDELLAATSADLLPAYTARQALDTTFTTVDGLARHGYRLQEWLRTMDITLTWQRH